jgi:hypothetical protein
MELFARRLDDHMLDLDTRQVRAGPATLARYFAPPIGARAVS